MMSATRTVLLAFWSVGFCCSASDITVRLLDGKSGTPLAGRRVITWINLKPAPHMVEALTASDGAASVHVPEDQPPPTITVATDDHQYPWVVDCVRRSWRENEFSYPGVLASGALSINACEPKGGLKPRLTASPGEVVIFASKPSKWRAFWMNGQW
jgi:hypothetical protein